MKKESRRFALGAVALIAGLMPSPAKADVDTGMFTRECHILAPQEDGQISKTDIFYRSDPGGIDERLKSTDQLIKPAMAKSHFLLAQGTIYHWTEGSNDLFFRPANPDLKKPGAVRRVFDEKIAAYQKDPNYNVVCEDGKYPPEDPFLPPTPSDKGF